MQKSAITRKSSISTNQSFGPNSNKLKKNFKLEIASQLEDVENAIKFQNLKTIIQELNDTKATPQAKKLRKLYIKLRIPRNITFAVILLISFFETPQWCERGKYINNCQNLKSNPDVFIPQSNLPYMNKYAYWVIEVVLLLFLTFNKFLENQYKVRNEERQKTLNVLFGLTGVITLGNVVQMVFKGFPINLSLFLLPVFYVMYSQKLKRLFVTYYQIIKKGVALIFVSFLSLIIFCGIGIVIFQDVPENENIFAHFEEAMYQMLILQTTSNFPSIMMPFYIRYRWAPIFFISFLIINCIILTNMFLGVFYSHFKEELQQKQKLYYLQFEDLQEQLNKFQEKQRQLARLKTQKNFKAFNVIGSNMKEDLKQEKMEKEKMEKSQTKKDSKKLNSKNNSESESDSDDDDDVKLDETDLGGLNFQRGFGMLARSKQKNFGALLESTENPQEEQKFFTAQEIIDMADDNFGKSKRRMEKQKGYEKKLEEINSQSNMKSLLCMIIFQKNKFSLIMGCLSMVQFMFIYISKLENSVIDPQEYIDLFINTIFVAEGILRVWILGPKYFITQKYYTCEFLISIALEISIIIHFIIPSNHTLNEVISYMVLTRVARFLIMLGLSKRIALINDSLINFIPFFIDTFGVLIILFLVFAGLGQEIFGGYYSTDKMDIITQDPDYVYNNFNDLANGFILLFQLLIVNDWHVNTQTAVYCMGSRWYRLFFIVWYIAGVVMAMNIMIAFIIDYLVVKWDQDRQRQIKQEEAKKQKEIEEEQRKQQQKKEIEMMEKDKVNEEEDEDDEDEDPKNKIQNFDFTQYDFNSDRTTQQLQNPLMKSEIGQSKIINLNDMSQNSINSSDRQDNYKSPQYIQEQQLNLQNKSQELQTFSSQNIEKNNQQQIKSQQNIQNNYQSNSDDNSKNSSSNNNNNNNDDNSNNNDIEKQDNDNQDQKNVEITEQKDNQEQQQNKDNINNENL